jgi:hypothetical protein
VVELAAEQITAEQAVEVLNLAEDGTVEVRGTVHSPRAAGRQTINRWPLAEAVATIDISELTRVADDPDGCRLHALTPGGRTYRFAAA